MTFYSPWAFLALIGVPVIIMLYLLKKKHQEYTVSSLFLWEEALKDLEANAPWQKLKKNILMLLQIIAVILLAFALSKPFLNTLGGKAGNVVLVIDTSFSMQAVDVGRIRFEEARDQARRYITNLKPGTFVTLISMGRNAVIEENLSSNKSSLLDKLEHLRVTNGISNLEDAKVLVKSIVKQQPGTEVVIFGDRDFNVPGVDVKFSRISNNGDNFAVILLSHTWTNKGLTVLSRIANYSTEDAVVPVSLYVDGIVFDAQNVDIKKGETASVYWDSVPNAINLIEVRIDKKDSLDIDNRAWNAVNKTKTNKVLLVSSGNVFIEKVVSLSNGVELFKTDFKDDKDLKGYDLYIMDGHMPEKFPSDGSIMILNPPTNKFFEVIDEVETPYVEELDEEIFKYADDFDFSIGKTRVFEVPKWGKEVIRLKEGNAAFMGQLDNRRVLALGFDIHNTDLPLTPAFPIIMTNALEWLLPSTIRNVESLLPGESITFNLDPKAQEAVVTSPSGKSFRVAPPFPAQVFEETDEVGLYTLSQKTLDGESSFYFAVNASSETESDLINDDRESALEEPSTEENQTKPLKTGMNLQTIFVWLVLAVLLIEWWVYSNGI